MNGDNNFDMQNEMQNDSQNGIQLERLNRPNFFRDRYGLGYGYKKVLLKWHLPDSYLTSNSRGEGSGGRLDNLGRVCGSLVRDYLCGYMFSEETEQTSSGTPSLVLKKDIPYLKMASFELEKERNSSGSICYNDEIKLKHIASGKYVTFIKAEGIMRDTQACLSDDSGDSNVCQFKIILPGNNSQNNNPIKIDDKVTFQAEDSYILLWDIKTKGFIWHKSDTEEGNFTINRIISEKFYDAINCCLKVLSSPIENTDDVLSPIKDQIDKIEKELEDDHLQCDDQSRSIQNYLRDPFCHDKVNLVKHFCKFIGRLDQCDEVLLRLLTKICVGNFENQKILVQSEALKVITKILIKKTSIELKISTISLLEILHEEIDKATKENVQKIAKCIDIMSLHETLSMFYEQKEYDNAIKTYNLLNHMEDFEGIKAVPTKHQLQLGEWNLITEIINAYYKDTKSAQEAWNYCAQWSRSIEILYRNEDGYKNLAKVHFRLHPEDEMTAKEEDIVKHHVHCGAPKNRLAKFLQGMKSIESRVHPPFFKILQMLCCRIFIGPYRKLFVGLLELLNYLLTVFTLVMNVLLLIAWENTDMKLEYLYDSPDCNESMLINKYCKDTVCYNRTINNSLFSTEDCYPSLCVPEASVPSIPDMGNDPHWFFTYALKIGGGIHTFLSSLMFIFFLIMNLPHFRLPRIWKIYKRLRMFLIRAGKLPDDHFKKEESPQYFKMPFHIVCVRLGYVSGFLACSGLALKYYGYFYCICLLHIIVDNVILQRVLKSITRNFSKLFWLVVLGLVVVYIYSVAAFALYADKFHDPDSSDVQYCATLLQCFITIFHYILIGGSPNLPSNFEEFAIRVIVYEVTFYIVITVIGINILYAIVVDTFIELREEWWQIERDHKQICFICQKFSSEFEKKGQGFDHHIFNDHYMFNYVYFKLHTDKIDKSKRNAMEWYVSKKINETRTEFFPLNQARCLNHTWSENKLDEIKSTVDDIKKIVDDKYNTHEP